MIGSGFMVSPDRGRKSKDQARDGDGAIAQERAAQHEADCVHRCENSWLGVSMSKVDAAEKSRFETGAPAATPLFRRVESCLRSVFFGNGVDRYKTDDVDVLLISFTVANKQTSPAHRFSHHSSRVGFPAAFRCPKRRRTSVSIRD